MAVLWTIRSRDGTWLVADMHRFDPPTQFNGIIAWLSFFHLNSADQRAMIRHFATLVRPGGSIMFTAGPQAGDAWSEWQGAPLFHASLALEEYCELLSAAGFDAIEFVEGAPIAFLWLATREWMMPLAVEAVRAEVRAGLRARHAMLRDEAVPPELAVQIVLRLCDLPTPIGISRSRLWGRAGNTVR